MKISAVNYFIHPRFVDAREGRSAIWLKQTVRRRENALPKWKISPPESRRWADGIANALEEIAGGKTALFAVEPIPSSHPVETLRIALPHSVLIRDWVQPSRAIRQCASHAVKV